jgi:hypothetical protein
MDFVHPVRAVIPDIERWRSEARAITGNWVEVLEVSHHEVRARLDGNATLWRGAIASPKNQTIIGTRLTLPWNLPIPNHRSLDSDRC